MRHLLFDKRVCTIEQDHQENLVLSYFGLAKKSEQFVERGIVIMATDLLKEKEKNKVLWWNNRSVLLYAKNQYQL